MPGILAGVPMAASKRPSTSSLRRFITSRPYVTVAELRRRFGLDDPDAMSCLAHDGRQVYVGLPEREALKIDDLLGRGEIGVQLSVEVRAPVAVGVYPMRIARYVVDGAANANDVHPVASFRETDPDLEGAQPLGAEIPAIEITALAADVPDAGAVDHGAEPDHLRLEDAIAPMNGIGDHPSLSRPRGTRATRHNGRPVPHRHRRIRHPRPQDGPAHPPSGPQ
jgi:hypothetical protein